MWIEIQAHTPGEAHEHESLPSRECGLKLRPAADLEADGTSLPSRECGLKSGRLVGAGRLRPVTPLAGVWIEILALRSDGSVVASLPSRECGLKSRTVPGHDPDGCHSPRGSVD